MRNADMRLYAKWNGGSLAVYPGDAGPGKAWFVDTTNGSATGDGKSWTSAFSTLALGNAAASAGDTIYIRTHGVAVTVAEEITVAGLRLIGCGTCPKDAAYLTAAADGVALKISAQYVEVANIYFKVPAYSAGTPAAIELSGANYARIHHCRFQGQTAAHQAIYSAVCDSDNVEISDCEFMHINTATYGAAILGVEAAGATYSAWRILRNTFSGCVTAVNIGGRCCRVEGNTFMEYGTPAAGGEAAAVCTKALDLSGAQTGGNVVFFNTMQGDYDSDSGLYTPGTYGDCWMGNFATDVAEDEVDADGLTVAVPAV